MKILTKIQNFIIFIKNYFLVKILMNYRRMKYFIMIFMIFKLKNAFHFFKLWKKKLILYFIIV